MQGRRGSWGMGQALGKAGCGLARAGRAGADGSTWINTTAQSANPPGPSLTLRFSFRSWVRGGSDKQNSKAGARVRLGQALLGTLLRFPHNLNQRDRRQAGNQKAGKEAFYSNQTPECLGSPLLLPQLSGSRRAGAAFVGEQSTNVITLLQTPHQVTVWVTN